MSRALIVTRQRARLGSRRARILVVVGSHECQRHQPLVSAPVLRAFPKEPVRRRRVVYARTVIGLINHFTSSLKNPRFVAWLDVFLKFSQRSSPFQQAPRRSTAKFQPEHRHSGRSTVRWKIGCASKIGYSDIRSTRAASSPSPLRIVQQASVPATSRRPGGRLRRSTSAYSASSCPPAVPDARSISLVLLKNCSGHLC